MVRKLTFKGIFSHKIRFALTTFAVLLGVSFVAGSFVLTDSLRSAFDDLFDEVTEETDVVVRSTAAFESNEGTQREPLPDTVLADITSVPGVVGAQGDVTGYAQLLELDGDAVTTSGGAPLLGQNWYADDTLNPLRMVEGRPPAGPGEVAIDEDQAEASDFAIGDRTTVLLQDGRQEVEIVGIAAFGDSGSLAGARMVLFDTETAQEVLGNQGTFDAILVRGEEGADVEALRQDVGAVLGDGLEAVDSETVAEESKDAVGSFIDIFNNVLLAFAGVALFVSAFFINNTFTIILGQRVRELALMRAIGASTQQVRGMVVGEALIVGVLATVLGILGGIGVATGLKAIFNATGAGIPDGPTVLLPRTFIAAAVIGIGVTLVAAIAPARKASTVPPVAAMRSGFTFALAHPTRRLVIGAVVTAVGAALLGFGLFGDPGSTAATLSSVGLGAVLVFLGIARLSQVVARPVSTVLGAPLTKVFGMAGRLAQQNAGRNPQRTASTASALMIGLAMVSMIAVVGASVVSTFRGQLERGVQADYFITGSGFTPFSTDLSRQLAEQPEVAAVTGIRFASVQVDGDTKQLTAGDAAALPEVVDVGVLQGSIDDIGSDGILVHEDPAEDLGLQVGDPVTVTFQATGPQELRVAGIYEDASIMGNWVTSLEVFERNVPEQLDFFVGARAADGVSPEESRAAVERITTGYPQLEVQDRTEFRQSQEDQINQVLLTVVMLLLFAVGIAILGIGTTVALSVFERTRELGLLRAVGMTRRQLKRMVRWEAALVSLFGAVLGVTVGVVFGLALASALPETIVDTLSIPAGQIATIVVLTAAVGLLAAYLPARRAAKLDVLRAIGTE